MLHALLLLIAASSFRIEKKCEAVNNYITAYENVFVYDNKTEHLAKKFVDECSQYADPYALLVYCNSQQIPQLANVTSEIMPIFIKKTYAKPLYYTNANCSYIREHESLSVLKLFNPNVTHSQPYLHLYINMTLNDSIYDEFAEIAKMKVLVFNGYYYSLISGSSKPYFKLVDERNSKSYYLEGLNPSHMVSIMKEYLNDQAKARSAAVSDAPSDYMVPIVVVVVCLWTAFLSLFCCRSPFRLAN